MSTLYKVTGEEGKACHGGSGSWNLPHGKRAGKWMPEVTGPVVPCSNGYHLARRKDLIEWLGPVIWIAEGNGDCVKDDFKVVYRRARLISRVEHWNDISARLFAADCAERALKIANDKRCDAAVEAARLFAFGLIDDNARDAARDAAWDAAGAAARDAAWDAAWDAARAAAGAAAWAAAGAAARDAARAAAGAAARDAARDAAWDAAWDAARAAAWDAAWDAARAAARDAAWDAAWDAERKWQTNRLFQYLNGRVDLEKMKKSLEARIG